MSGRTVGRLALAVGVGWALPGCVELAVLESLGNHEDGVEEVDEGRFDSEIFGEEDAPAAWAQAAVDVRGGTLRGDMGAVQGLDDPDPMLRGWSYEGYTSLEVHAQATDGSGAAMAILDLSSELSDASLRPGTRLQYDATAYTGADLGVTLIGCSGPTEGAWEFDQSAEAVTVDVSEGTAPDSLLLEFEGRFATYADDGAVEQQVVRGSIEVATQATDG